MNPLIVTSVFQLLLATEVNLQRVYHAKAIKDTASRKLCCTGSAENIRRVRSLLECSTLCNNNNLCLQFNFRNNIHICELFEYNQQSCNLISGCSTYSIYRTSVCPAVKTVDYDICNFPFTYQNCTFLFNKCDSYCQSNIVWNMEVCDYEFTSWYSHTAVNISSIMVPVLTINNWIIIQQRLDINVNFNFNFSTYEKGFGDQDNFWLGLTKIYTLTKNQNYRIRFEFLISTTNKWYSAEYSYFYLDPTSSLYALRIGTYIGDAGDAIRFPIAGRNIMGFPFYTIETVSFGCLQYMSGGWWINNCVGCHLNSNAVYSVWGTLFPDQVVSSSRMMVKA